NGSAIRCRRKKERTSASNPTAASREPTRREPRLAIDMNPDCSPRPTSLRQHLHPLPSLRGAAVLDLFDSDRAEGGRRMFDRPDQGVESLAERYEAEAAGGFGGGRHSFREGVERGEQVGPVVAGAEDVPGADEGAAEAGRGEPAFAFGADGPVGTHYGGRMGDAQVDDVRQARGPGHLGGVGRGAGRG